MKNEAFLKIGFALLFLLIIFMSLFFFTQNGDSPSTTDSPPLSTTLPVLNKNAGGSVPSQNNSETSPLIEHPETVDLGSGNYIVAGGNDLYEEPPFQILFYEPDQSYTVSLLQVPLGSARRNAEVALLKLINVSVDDACVLPIMVTVPFSVDAAMSGRDLGFSFCEGGIPLP